MRRRLGCLKPDQRTALILQAAGYSYAEIGAGCAWSHTKVNRCVSEGRAALRQTGQLALSP
jgi:DNA-directed RNA polymerase specialized sigma24 family protein